ncbi:UDP-glucose-4-epimerase [Hypoxylon texense]
MPLFSTTPSVTLRAAFRRQLEQLRVSRLPRSAPRRFQSTNPNPNPNPNPGPKDAPKPKPKPEPKPAKVVVEDPIPVGSTPAVPPLPLWLRLGPLTRAGQAYARAQRARPWATQVATSVFIYLAADLSAQRIGGREYAPERTARNLVVGTVWAVPGYLWFIWLSRNFNYASHAVSIAVKIVVNQLVFTPTFNSYFFGFQALLAGDSLPEIWDRVRRTVPVSWVNAWKLWPAVTAFSFTFVPIEYRSVFAGVVAVGWQTYLSYLNRQAEIEEEAAHGRVAALPAPVEEAPPQVQADVEKRRIAA